MLVWALLSVLASCMPRSALFDSLHDSPPSCHFPAGQSDAGRVITDVAIGFNALNSPLIRSSDASHQWCRIQKDLFLHRGQQKSWLYIQQAFIDGLNHDDLVVTNVHVGEHPSTSDISQRCWEFRPGGIWLQRSKFDGNYSGTLTGLDVLYGDDTVDPRPEWCLRSSPLQLDAPFELPVAKLTVRFGLGGSPSGHRLPLRARSNGKFKIVQISDTHLVTGPGTCEDAIDEDGQLLPKSEADPLTLAFLGKRPRSRAARPGRPYRGPVAS